MEISNMVEKIRTVSTEAKSSGVGVQFIVTYDDWNRPLKTGKGAIKKLRRRARYGFGTFLAIQFIGKNGKEYKTIKSALKYGS